MVRDAATAATAVQLLKDDDAGRASLLLAGAPAAPAQGRDGGLPAGARWARRARDPRRGQICGKQVRPEQVRRGTSAGDASGETQVGARCRLLSCWLSCSTAPAVVEDLDAAARLIAARPELTAVTRTGDVFTAFTVSGGSASARRCSRFRPPSTTPPPGSPASARNWNATASPCPPRNPGARAAQDARMPPWKDCTTPTPGSPPWRNGWAT